MARRDDPHTEMAHARQSDGINVIFDQNSPDSSHTHSRSRSRSSSSSSNSHSSGPSRYRGRGSHKGRYRSPSSSSSTSSSSSRSSSRHRSRSHPRCHRHSPRCRCDNHPRYGRSYYCHSPPGSYKSRSRSYSRWPSRHCNRRCYRSRSSSRSSGRWGTHSRGVSRFRCRFSRSPVRTYRYRSRSRSSGRSVSLSVDEKRELLKVAKTKAMKILGVEKVDLPESVQSILHEQSESKCESAKPRVRQGAAKTVSQSNVAEPDDVSSSKMSPKMKICFSPNNSVAKPTVASSSSAKVTPRVDSYESRKPYGHWIPIKPVQTSSAH